MVSKSVIQKTFDAARLTMLEVSGSCTKENSRAYSLALMNALRCLNEAEDELLDCYDNGDFK
jgi:hypothetical protein